MIDLVYLDHLGKASTALQIPSGGAPFDRGEWFAMVAEHGGSRAFHAIATDCNGTATALLALCKQDGRIQSLANWYTFRWRPLFSGESDPLPLLERIAADLPRHGWRITLDQVPDEDGSATLLTKALRKAGWRVLCEAHDLNHVLPVSGRSYAEYLATRPGALRTTLKRRTAKVECEVLTRFDEQVWRHYEAIYAASWKPEEGLPAFLEAFARAEGEAGRLRLGLARVGGEPVAAQFWTVENGTAYIHKLAHREDAGAQSPGTVLSAAMFEQAIDRDHVELIDFGTGDNPYKRDWMDDIRPRYRIDALWPLAPRAWPRLAARLLRG